MTYSCSDFYQDVMLAASGRGLIVNDNTAPDWDDDALDDDASAVIALLHELADRRASEGREADPHHLEQRIEALSAMLGGLSDVCSEILESPGLLDRTAEEAQRRAELLNATLAANAVLGRRYTTEGGTRDERLRTTD
jgi:hypothetical protein